MAAKAVMGHVVTFGRHRFDLHAGRLWSGRREIRLTPKAAAVLAALIGRAGEPVTRRELFALVWGETIVGDASLTTCIRELREALEDDAVRPRFIETRHRRGYRFVAPLHAPPVAAPPEPGSLPPAAPAGLVVGRAQELTQLRTCLEEATGGRRRLVFVTGEPGIGKTTLVEAFLADVGAPRAVRVAYGRCIEHYGAGEPYLPLMEAITRWGREADGHRVVRLLREHAPSWLFQMPSLIPPAERRVLQRQVAGTTRERMLRELAETIEIATREIPLVLWLEDLHWSDVSTLDWLAYLARRPGPARLLLLASYRPAEVLGRGHPLEAIRAELEVQGRCRDLALSLLSETAVGLYIARRYPSTGPLDSLVSVLHRRTSGNPLFVAHLCDELVRTGVLVERDGQWALARSPEAIALPGDISRMIGLQLDRLTAFERRILAAASVAGTEFSSLATAAAADVSAEAVEACCAELVRRELFLVARGDDEWPDGSVAGRYAFRHAIGHDTVYERLPPGRRAAMHRRVAARLETVLGAGVGDAAAEVAMHFELGREPGRAIRHRHRAGQIASQRGASIEAAAHLTRALELLVAQADRPTRIEEELAIQIALGGPLMAIKGRGAPEVERAYRRAQALCEQVGDVPRLFPALWGLFLFRRSRGEIDAALDLGRRLLALARQRDDAGLLLQAHHALWATRFARGELLLAREHAAQGGRLYDADRHARLAAVYGNHDPGVCALAHGAWALALLDEPEAASRAAAEAIALARTVGHQFSQAHALLYAARVHQLRGDWRSARAHAETARDLARDNGFIQLVAWADVMRGWALVQDGRGEDGIATARTGIAAITASGSRDFVTYFLSLLAESLGRAGQAHHALTVVLEALGVVERGGERFYEAELHRLKGEVMRQGGGEPDRVLECFQTALAVARHQGARALERRILTGLGQAGAGRPPFC
jgi:predicted ATPase/DNA-binding winged helix-turn-helix (wHTH) protein